MIRFNQTMKRNRRPTTELSQDPIKFTPILITISTNSDNPDDRKTGNYQRIRRNPPVKSKTLNQKKIPESNYSAL